VGEIRRARYTTLRSVVPSETGEDADAGEPVESLASIVLPPGAWAVGRSLNEVRQRGAEVAFTALRRQGITGREPDGQTVLKEGDVLVVFGLPGALEHAEALLLAG
jgi:monovalent cation:H+ antiporter-2, CPA2 family